MAPFAAPTWTPSLSTSRARRGTLSSRDMLDRLWRKAWGGWGGQWINERWGNGQRDGGQLSWRPGTQNTHRHIRHIGSKPEPTLGTRHSACSGSTWQLSLLCGYMPTTASIHVDPVVPSRVRECTHTSSMPRSLVSRPLGGKAKLGFGLSWAWLLAAVCVSHAFGIHHRLSLSELMSFRAERVETARTTWAVLDKLVFRWNFSYCTLSFSSLCPCQLTLFPWDNSSRSTSEFC